MFRFGRNSLLWRLITPCLLGLIVVAAFNTGNWLLRFEDEIKTALLEKGRETTLIMTGAVVESVWDFDTDGAQLILGGFGHLEDFAFAEIVADGAPFARFDKAQTHVLNTQMADWPDAAFPANLQNGGIIVFKGRIRHPSGGEIGVLLAGFYTRSAALLLAQTQTATIISQLVSFGCLGLLLALVLRSVTRPLREITSVIDEVTGGNLARKVPYADREDEVGRLAKAVSVFQNNAAQLVNVQAEAEASRRIAEKALVDDLTGLPNRRALSGLFEELESAGAGAEAPGIALLHIDLDGFKQINDTLGHKAGDFVLKGVSARLLKAGKACRMIARIGGDEFVAVLTGPGSAPAETLALANALVDALHRPFEFEGQSLRVGCSAGIAYHSRRNIDLFDTLVQADIALYKAKANGKNQAIEFDEAQRAAMRKRKSLADQIQRAIERDEFVPFFQPIVDSQTEKVLSLEVLARWEHPEFGRVGPGEFLDLATELKLMRYVDRSVLGGAIRAMEEIAEEVEAVPRISVNVSLERLMEKDLLETVKSLRNSPVQIDVEILESSFLDDIATQILLHLDQLKELGTRIYLDDFGTGHSSVAGLLRLGPDVVKIDRQFVAPATKSRQSRAVVEALIAIAETFDIEIVCEGIETREQADLMRDLGVRRFQGFFFHKPMDAASVRSLLLGEAGGAASARSA